MTQGPPPDFRGPHCVAWFAGAVITPLNLTLAMLIHYLKTHYYINHKNERFCSLPLKSVSGSENSRLDDDGNQQRSIANVKNDGF